MEQQPNISEFIESMSMGDMVALEKWLNIDTDKNIEYVFNTAVQFGSVSILQWIKDKKIPCPAKLWSPNICTEAAAKGHLDVIKWLIQNGCPCDERACNAAAKTGQLEVLKWLRQNNYHCLQPQWLVKGYTSGW